MIREAKKGDEFKLTDFMCTAELENYEVTFAATGYRIFAYNEDTKLFYILTGEDAKKLMNQTIETL